MLSGRTEATSNGNTVAPVAGPYVLKCPRDATGSIARQDGTITVWESSAPPAKAAVAATATVSAMRSMRSEIATPRGCERAFGA